ncbi:MAG: LPS export ABC transporter permease LptG [Rhodobacteraceae bacterium]|nr:LPS export ABC transporter permease LptG [Paracoccaceae bacterium]
MILHRYFAYRFLKTFGAVFLIFLGLSILFDLADQVRRFAGDGVSFGQMLQLSLLSAPVSYYRILPIIMLIATLTLLLSLSRSSELVVARAAGRSALRALAAPALMAFLIGVITVAVLNPLTAAMSKEYEQRVNDIDDDGSSVLSISDEGLWLRQGTADSQTVIRALSSNLDGTTLEGVTFISFARDGEPVRRIEAATATLTEGGWNLVDAKAWPLSRTPNPEQAARVYEELRIPSDLTREGIRDSFGTPSAIPIWDLPAFIEQLERAGFSARRHLVWFHIELALPAFMVAMLLVAAGFTMRHTRVSRTDLMVLYAVMLGFGLYFIRNFAQILGENGQMPVLLAAWAPPLGAIGLALGLLLHLEDG